MTPAAVAVIDLGSNSSRVVVFRVGPAGVLDVVVDEHVSLQLIRGLDREGRLRDHAIEGALRLLADFRRLAEAAGARRIYAYGTAALREAKNSDVLLERARTDCGVRVEIMGGAEEGKAGFLGAVHALPVTDGLVFDIGGGSLQVTRFRDRKLQKTCSLPLGALRVSDEFLSASDPPQPAKVRKLRAHVHRLLRSAKIGRISAGQSVVGTGGTVRNLAKVAVRRWEHPIQRLHGYDLTRARLRELLTVFLGRDAAARGALPGLSRRRGDSILGGCIVADSVLEACEGTHFLVAQQGMREGSVLSALGGRLAAPDRVRVAAVQVFASRFSTCDPQRAERRARIALSLYDRLEPYREPTSREMLGHAAMLLDAGSSVDYFRLQMHTASMIRSSGLAGFSHRGIALLSTMVEMSEHDGSNPRYCSPPLVQDDFDALERAGVILGLADAIERRRPPGPPEPVSARAAGRAFVLTEEGMASWRDPELEKRFRDAFGKELTRASGESATAVSDERGGTEAARRPPQPGRSRKSRRTP